MLKTVSKMSEKIINNTLSEKFKEKVGHKIPDDFDLSSIGKIDLHEAERIANEEIVFLSEEDLIDGLEDFELIPVKPSAKIAVLPEEKPEVKESAKSGTMEVSAAGGIDYDEVLFEDFSGVEAPQVESEKPVISTEEELYQVSTVDVREVIDEEPGTGEEAAEPETSIEEKRFEELPPEKETEAEAESEEFVAGDESDVYELDLDEMILEETVHEEIRNESEILKQRINEGSFDSQLGDIVKPQVAEEEYEFLPGIYDDSSLGENIKFIDDSYVEKKLREAAPVFESDPLTENLVRMVDVSDGKLLIIDEVAEPHERIEYILDNSRAYDAETLALLFKEERFMDDTDFDFIDNAIVRDDYTVYIQEIDDFLKSREVLSGSEVYEILGLMPEEIHDIDEKLFGDYYKEFDDEYELEFISPELSFFDRGFVKKKELRYFINDENSFFDDEKKSIEDDITSESAIIFEEDVVEIKKLLDETDFDLKRKGNIPELMNIQEIEEIEEIREITDEVEVQPELIDITDRIIILEDRHEVERITSEFPEKRDDLVKLLSYLDGLLEKLPEEAIRKFAESEYFDLYAKVLKETGKQNGSA